ncbi:MAG: hypothetical protein ACLR56_09095 [Oscillospiraceae bacterium]
MCLPDDAAREAAAFAENPDTVSNRHLLPLTVPMRILYTVFPKLPITGKESPLPKTANRLPCKAAFISLIAPLTENKIIAPDTPLSCFSLTGYSGGGKKMIAEYKRTEETRCLTHRGCRAYAEP